MAVDVRLFSTKIEDEYGGAFSSAIVSLRNWSGSITRNGRSEEGDQKYKRTTTPEGLSYEAMYWYSAQTKAEGKRSRPLAVEVDGAFTTSIPGNLNNQAVLAALNEPVDGDEAIIRACIADLKARFI